jgi:hypothetical protein
VTVAEVVAVAAVIAAELFDALTGHSETERVTVSKSSLYTCNSPPSEILSYIHRKLDIYMYSGNSIQGYGFNHNMNSV